MSRILLLKPSSSTSPHGLTRKISTLLYNKPPLRISPSHSLPVFSPLPPNPLRSQLPRKASFPVRALESSAAKVGEGKGEGSDSQGDNGAPSAAGLGAGAEYPIGEFEMEEFDWWKSFLVKTRMLFALPWERVKKGSVLSMKLRGQISDQLKSRFTSGLSLPQICENFTKAAYDPRISGIYLQIEPLSCGWGKVDEMRRHILNFKKSENVNMILQKFLPCTWSL